MSSPKSPKSVSNATKGKLGEFFFDISVRLLGGGLRNTRPSKKDMHPSTDRKITDLQGYSRHPEIKNWGNAYDKDEKMILHSIKENFKKTYWSRCRGAADLPLYFTSSFPIKSEQGFLGPRLEWDWQILSLHQAFQMARRPKWRREFRSFLLSFGIYFYVGYVKRLRCIRGILCLLFCIGNPILPFVVDDHTPDGANLGVEGRTGSDGCRWGDQASVRGDGSVNGRNGANRPNEVSES